MVCWLPLLLFSFGLAGPVCMDQNSKPVDWFIMYKFPVISTSTSPITKAGLGFAYMDANMTFVSSPQSLNDTNNPLYYTLQQIYTANGVAGLAYMMYNDENPVTGGTTSTYGHTKGTAAWDATDGFWLLHSVPAWPPAGNTSYSFGAANAPTYAQTFLCTSLDAANLNAVFDQWAWTRPWVYSAFMDGTLNASFPGAAAVLAGKRVQAAPWTNVANVTTKAGLQFTYLAKYTNWGMELYEDLVAPTLGVHLNTETWQNGVGTIDSYCAPNYTWNVQNIGGVSLSADATWTNSKDHAKWAISDSCASAPSDLWVCIGDINRQTGQFSRAGGTMCIDHYQIYSGFQKTIMGFKTNCTDGNLCVPPPRPTTTPTPAPAPGPSSQGEILLPTMALVTLLLFF